MKKFMLLFLIPLQLSACPYDLEGYLSDKIEEFSILLKYASVSSVEKENVKYYFMGLINAYTDILYKYEEIKNLKPIESHEDFSYEKCLS